MEQIEDSPSRSASPAFVNKLLVELNAANSEIERLQDGNLAQRDGLSADVVALQDQLQRTQTELDQVRKDFASTKEDIATREFEFATTIKSWRKKLKWPNPFCSRLQKVKCQSFLSLLKWKKTWLLRNPGFASFRSVF